MEINRKDLVDEFPSPYHYKKMMACLYYKNCGPFNLLKKGDKGRYV